MNAARLRDCSATSPEAHDVNRRCAGRRRLETCRIATTGSQPHHRLGVGGDVGERTTRLSPGVGPREQAEHGGAFRSTHPHRLPRGLAKRCEYARSDQIDGHRLDSGSSSRRRPSPPRRIPWWRSWLLAHTRSRMALAARDLVVWRPRGDDRVRHDRNRWWSGTVIARRRRRPPSSGPKLGSVAAQRAWEVFLPSSAPWIPLPEHHCPKGQGERWSRGANQRNRLLGAAEATADTFRDGWVFSGEFGRGSSRRIDPADGMQEGADPQRGRELRARGGRGSAHQLPGRQARYS